MVIDILRKIPMKIYKKIFLRRKRYLIAFVGDKRDPCGLFFDNTTVDADPPLDNNFLDSLKETIEKDRGYSNICILGIIKLKK